MLQGHPIVVFISLLDILCDLLHVVDHLLKVLTGFPLQKISFFHISIVVANCLHVVMLQ